MARPIGAQKALEMLKKVAAATPDRKVKACAYVHNGAHQAAKPTNTNLQPGCLVGKVLIDEVGVDPKVFITPRNDPYPGHRSINEMGIGSSFVQTALKEAGVNLTDSALRVLREAQAAQDDGKVWSDAVAHAEAVHKGQIDPLF